MKTRTLRGQVEEGVVKRLVVDDGRLNIGYKVISIVVAPDVTGAGNDVMATLSLDYDTPLAWNWGDNRQIGWASTTGQGVAALLSPYSVIDPDHIVVRDLYIQGQILSSGGSGVINYLIELEAVELSDDQAVLALIKERSQDDWR